MLAEHRAAFSALLWGGIALLVFFAPFFIYSGEYSEKEKAKGVPDNGDIVSMVGQALGLHISIAFFVIMAISIVNIIFQAIPDMRPEDALKNFFMTNVGGGDINEFVKKWMTNITASGGGTAPISQASKDAFIAARMFVGIITTFLFVAIPLIILFNSIKIMLTPGTGSMQNEQTDLDNIIRGVTFFIGSILLLGIHSLIASVVVMAGTGNTNFSYFLAMQKIWKYILIGL